MLPNLRPVPRSEATLLGAAMGDISLDTLLRSFLTSFGIVSQRLQKLSSHDALFLLRTCLSMPKLLHTLRTSPSFTRTALLKEIDSAFSQSLSSILNVNFNPSQIAQASLPVKLGGFGIVSSVDIASSAFLSSLHAADPICRLISPEWSLLDIATYQTALTQWKSQCPTPMPTCHLALQKAWSLPLHRHLADSLSASVDDPGRARLFSCRAFGSGDWLYALPSTSLGLHLNDEQLRIAAAVRLGAPVSVEHILVR